MPFEPGQQLLHYRLTEKIGQGGMGVVWKATDTKLNREVALKTLPAEMAADPAGRARFERESQAIAALNHPNIVTIHSVENAEGVSFITMELIDGRPLGRAIPADGFPLDGFLDVAVPLTAALSAAHDKGITHRDIKPDNLMLTAAGHLKVLDFGLAKVTATGAAAADPAGDATRTRVTEEGKILGTVAYMSPEQAEGKAVDPRSDVFSLGIVLYQMATGTTPFHGDTPISTITSIIRDEPQPIGELKPALPQALGRIVGRCLSKDSQQRYATATELHRDLMELKSTGGAPSAGAGVGAGVGASSSSAGSSASHETGSGSKLPWIGAAIVVGLLIAGAMAWLRPDSSTTGFATATDDPTASTTTAYTNTDPAETSIAVLPLSSVGTDEQSLTFSSGIHNDLLIRLSKISSLKVISRTSVMEYGDTTKSMRQIADELGVTNVLEGSVQRAGNRVRLNVKLVDAVNDESLWAESYDREFNVDSIFDIQADVTGQIAGALQARLTPDEQRQVKARPTENLEAYEAYLRGLEFFERSEERAARQLALQNFEQAIKIDPEFAEAFAALARAHTNVYWVYEDRSPERLAMALEAIETAERLSPGLPEASLARAFYHYWGFLEYDQAMAEFEVARRGLPNHPMIPAGMGYVRRRQGRMDEAVDYLRRATELDPLSQAAANVHYTQFYARQYEEAERGLRRLRERDPGNPLVHGDLARLLAVAYGNVAGACEVIEGAKDLGLRDPVLERIAFMRPMLQGCDLALTQRYLDALDPGMPGVNDQFTYWPRPLVEAWLYRSQEDDAATRARLEAARVELEAAARERPDDARIPSALGLVYGELGRKDDAVRQGLRGVEMLPYETEAVRGAQRLFDLAAIYALVDEPDLAVDRLEFLLERPTGASAALLRVDPVWDPIRDHPRFRALVED